MSFSNWGEAPIPHCRLESLKDILKFLAHTGYKVDLSQLIMSTDAHKPFDSANEPHWFDINQSEEPIIKFKAGKLQPRIPYSTKWNSKVKQGESPFFHKTFRLLEKKKGKAFIEMKGKGVNFEQYSLANTVIDSQEPYQAGNLPVSGAEKALNAWIKLNDNN